MRVVILAAGQGTRLAPITNDRPKCLAELGGTSLLDHQLSSLHSLNITDITIVAGYRAECLADLGLPVVINPNYASSNMVYTLFCASSVMRGDSDLIIAYGDIVYEPRIIEALISCPAPVCVAVDVEWRRYWELRMDDPLSDAETLKLDDDGLILELGKRPRNYGDIQAQYLGLIKVRADHVPEIPRMFEALAPEGPYDGKTRMQMYMTSFIQHLIDSDWRIQAVPVNNGWLEVDTYAELQLYNQMYSEGTLSQFYRSGADTSDSIETGD